MEFFKGKRTYIIVGLFVLAIVIKVALKVEIPDYLFGILGALGLTAVKLGIQAISGNKGWRTYAAAAVVGLTALAQMVGWTWFPVETVYTLAGALGLLGVRKAVTDITKV